MSNNTCTVPILADALEAACSSDWHLSGGEYYPHQARVKVLVNGQAAFGAVHEAIARAKKTVLIICWGFQPSMHFVRNGDETIKYSGLEDDFPTQIGKLLEYKAANDVKVCVLSYTIDILGIWNIGKWSIGEAPLPGYLRNDNKPDYQLDSEYQESQRWFKAYAQNKEKGKPHFRTRNVDAAPKKEFEDKGLSLGTKEILDKLRSHHQKMVLVDYEDKEGAKGFVMGHNTLDHYWDTDAHSYTQKTHKTGRNGNVPFHDFSVQVTGPVIGDLFHNFKTAWKKSGGEDLEPKQALTVDDYPIVQWPESQASYVQLLRTQPETTPPVEDIKKMYLQNLNNASSLVYVENQYFRWPPFAEKLKRLAAKYSSRRDYPLYLFVLTNSSNDGVGAGEENTYRMLAALGKASEGLPNVDRSETLEALQSRLRTASNSTEINELRKKCDELTQHLQTVKQLESTMAKAKAALDEAQTAAKVAKAQNLPIDTASVTSAQQKYHEAQKQYEDKALAAHQRDEEEAEPEGLKTLICSLVAPDTPPGVPWQEVYIHAKMMMVNDAFLTIGSTNINTRSMEVDSELNLAIPGTHIARGLRKKLWHMHTGDEGPADLNSPESLKLVYENWTDLLEENAKRQKLQKTPKCSLRRFRRGSPSRKNQD